MRARSILSPGLVLSLVLSLILAAVPVFKAGAQETVVDITDPEGDVEDFYTGDRGDHPEIDGLKLDAWYDEELPRISSDDRLVAELAVAGEIDDSMAVSYSLQLTADGAQYVYTYSGGEFVQTFPPAPADMGVAGPNASGARTSVLHMEVPVLWLGGRPDTIEIGVLAFKEVDGSQFADIIPDDFLFPGDDPLIITSPTDGAAVFGEVTIAGSTSIADEEIQEVKVQIDQGDWKSAESNNRWMTWDYYWDSTSYDPGWHRVSARMVTDQGEYDASVDYLVDQDMAGNPPRIRSPMTAPGDVLNSTGEINLIYDDESIVGSVYQQTTVEGAMEWNGTGCYRVRKTGTINAEYRGAPLTIRTEGFEMWDRTDLALLHSDMWSNVSISLGASPETASTHSITDFVPPLDIYQFPIIVGKQWFATTTAYTYQETWGSVAGQSLDDSGHYVEETTFRMECLREEEVDLDSGPVETLVIRSESFDDSSDSGYGSLMQEFYTHSLSYFSDELGHPVRNEEWGSSDEPTLMTQVTSYRRGDGSYLEISSTEIVPITPLKGDEVTITVVVYNSGTTTSVDTPVSLEVDGVMEDVESVDVAAGGEKEIVFMWEARGEGEHSIRVSAGYGSEEVVILVKEDDGPVGNLSMMLILVIVLVAVAALVFGAIMRNRGRKREDDVDIRVMPVTRMGEVRGSRRDDESDD